MRRESVVRRRLEVSELGLEAVSAVWMEVQIAEP
jgi:hypothetical protein